MCLDWLKKYPYNLKISLIRESANIVKLKSFHWIQKDDLSKRQKSSTFCFEKEPWFK